MSKLLIEPFVKKQIDNILQNPQAKAIGLVGKTGVGKMYIARKIARNLVPKIVIDSNFLQIDGQNDGIEQVRIIQKKLSLTTTGHNLIRRIVVIDHADQLSREAQNSLLKTLEEPPLDTLIILNITDVNNILPTIKSRITSIIIKPISLNQATNFYSQSDTSELEKNYHISFGHARLLDELMRNNQNNNLVTNINYAKSIIAKNRLERLSMIDEIIKNKAIDISEILDAMLVIFDAILKKSFDAENRSEKISNNLNYIDKINQTSREINKGCNTKLALTKLFFSL